MIRNELTETARKKALRDTISTLIMFADNEFPERPNFEGNDWYVSASTLASRVSDLYGGGGVFERYGNITNADIVDLIDNGRKNDELLAEGVRVAKIVGRNLTQHGYGINRAKIEDLRKKFPR